MLPAAKQAKRSYVVLDLSRFTGSNRKLLSANGCIEPDGKSYHINAIDLEMRELFTRLHTFTETMKHVGDIVVISDCTPALSRDLQNWCQRRHLHYNYYAHNKTFNIMLVREKKAG